MGLFISFLWGLGMWVVIQLIRLAMADCDLMLQWAAKFGKKPSHLIGKVIWITGASSGIGEHLAYEFAKAGCRLVLSARRRDELERVKAKCILSGSLTEDDVLVLPLDMTHYDTHVAAVDTVLEKFNRIDILVNNAGVGLYGHFLDMTMEMERHVYEVNTLGPLSLTRAVLPHMYAAKQGQIAVVSSLAGKAGVPYLSSYSASKHAVHGAFESLRIEANEHNVSVTMMCPGTVDSGMELRVVTGERGGPPTAAKLYPMSVERCAFLCAAAITNKLQEVWMCRIPVLFGAYFAQYAPTYGRRFGAAFGTRIIGASTGK